MKRCLAGLLALALTLAPPVWAASDDSTVDRVLKRGVLKVGLSTFVPWAMKDKTGQLIGFEVDVARRLAQDMGVRVQFVQTKWAGIIPALLTGKFDVIIGGMGIKTERNKKVNFTIPYDLTGQTICASQALAAGFSTPADFNKPGVRIGVRLGSTSAPAVRKYMPQAELLQFDEEPQLYQELLNGRLTAVVASLPTPAFQALAHPDKLFAITKPFTTELVGFAVRKSDYDTVNFFDNWIRQVQAEGWLEERHAYWFETKNWEGLLK